jgi:ABC-type branched-subunit amino acid transport system ATPase component
MSILKIKDLSVAFGGVQALLNVDLSIENGEIHGLIGPNGAGKSTLFNAIFGVVKISRGHIFFEDREITGLKPYEVAWAGIARTFQNLKLFNDMSVLDNIMVGGLCHAKGRFWGSLLRHRRTILEDLLIREKAESLLDALGLIDLRNTLVSGLPYGQRKAVELARSLATDPKILLLDEPSAGMNVQETEAIINLLQRINRQGYTILLIEHDMRMIMGLSDRISVLDFGKKIGEGVPAEIVKNEQVIKAYLGH